MGKVNSNVPRGWVLKRADNNQYVEAIISNGQPDNPIVYYTRDIQEARAFVRCKAAEERAKMLGLMVIYFNTDDSGKREEVGCI